MSEEAALWSVLAEALSRLADDRAGEPVDFWLRDDDAVAPGAALDRLIRLASDAGAPLALAVIPGQVEAGLADRLRDAAGVAVLQHGFAHADHSAPGRKKNEFGPERPVETMLAELSAGQRRLSDFHAVQPIFVPPWNRIDPALVPRLPELGFRAVSTYGDRIAIEHPGAIPRLNAHVDPVDWRSGGGFLGSAAVLRMLIDRIGRLLEGRADRREPTGFLTHHRIHDEETFAFVKELLHFIGRQRACRWISAEMLLDGDTPVRRTAA